MHDFHTSINFEVKGNIILFSNFFFIKKVFKMITNCSKDMSQKRRKLISKVTDDEILRNIQIGFNYVQELKKKAYERMEELRQE